MRIFIVARGYPTKMYPQWGCFEKDQAEALAALGHEVVMISVDSRFRLRGRKYGLSLYRGENIKAIDLCLIPDICLVFSSYVQKKFKELELDYVYKKAVELYGSPDILYSHYLQISEIAVRIAARYNKPIVAIEHWSELNRVVIKPSIRKRAIYTYSKVSSLITVCNPLKQSIFTKLGFDSIVVHNMVNSMFFGNNVTRNDNKKIRFITTGNLIPIKGHDILIKAFAKCSLPKESWQMTIIGEGEERKNLEALIYKYNLSDNFFLLGKRNKEEVRDLLLSSDVFVMPSRTENFSVAVLEALASGLPVIASECGGIRECIDESNGILFPVEDIGVLSNCIDYMSKNYLKYDKKEISASCYSRFSSETIGKRLTQIFEEVLKKNIK